MKKLFALLMVLVSYVSYGQCDKKVLLTCDKIRMLTYGSVTMEIPVKASISINSEKIIISVLHEGETEVLDTEIKEVLFCSWSEYLKNGKTQYKGATKKGDEQRENSLIEIESEDGHTNVTLCPLPDVKGKKIQFNVTEVSIAEDVNQKSPVSQK